jgi:hypothetical protein
MRMRTLNNNTAASDPGGIRLSDFKLRRFHPELYRSKGIWRWFGGLSPMQRFWLTRMREHLLHGDSRAALVVSVQPLLVAAYTDELDCIALLHFPQELAGEYGLQVWTRLLTVNIYAFGTQPVADLESGPASYHRYSNFTPLIAEFVSEDRDRIEHRKAEIGEAEWQRTAALAHAYFARHGPLARDGRPMHSDTPATTRVAV